MAERCRVDFARLRLAARVASRRLLGAAAGGRGPRRPPLCAPVTSRCTQGLNRTPRAADEVPVSQANSPKTILSLSPPSSYAPLARIMLSQAGYSIISEERWEAHYANVRRAPDLVIVDAERVHELSGLPAILLYAHGQSVPWAPSAVGTIERPAGFHDLYRLVQAALEPNPRATPRVNTRIPARVRGAEAQVVSLSRGGCLIRHANP